MRQFSKKAPRNEVIFICPRLQEIDMAITRKKKLGDKNKVYIALIRRESILIAYHSLLDISSSIDDSNKIISP